MSSSNNHNPTRKNQHGVKVKKDDPQLVAALKEYHEQLMDSNKAIAHHLAHDHGDLDPAGCAGPGTIRHWIASHKGQHLPHAFVRETMRMHNPQGFEKQNSSAHKIVCHPKAPLGIHERWSCDGHDKLY
ncbi:hypothetical protein C0993_009497 [Termitomyces sp. T159_Od127]|nr:hypothetical protein C0993_009497 [Termitomyces sp. T159_Od127]